MKRKNVIISALVLAIALTGCSGKKVDYNMETEDINTKAGSDISAFDDSTKWNDSFAVETSDKSVDVDISADITLPDCKSMSVVEVKNIKVGADFKKSGAYIEAFGKSAQLAELRNVPSNQVLKSKADIDRYFGGK